jgi:hypothetical protein
MTTIKQFSTVQPKETFIEEDCTISHDGQEYSSGGSYIAECTDGKFRGMVYIKQEEHLTPAGLPYPGSKGRSFGTVTTWHGEQIARAGFTDYQGNFCNMRRVSFTWQGMNFVGDYCPDWSEVCKVRSTKAYN